MNRFDSTRRDPPLASALEAVPTAADQASDAPQRDLDPGRVPVAETLAPPAGFKVIAPPLAPIWPKGGQPSYRPKLRPR